MVYLLATRAKSAEMPEYTFANSGPCLNIEVPKNTGTVLRLVSLHAYAPDFLPPQKKHKVGLQVTCTAASCCKVDTRDGGPAVSYHCGIGTNRPKTNQQPFKLRHGIAMQLVATLQCHDGHRTIRNILETNTYLAQVSN